MKALDGGYEKEEMRTYIEAWVTRLSAVSCHNRKLSTLREELALFEMLGQVVVDDERALDNPMRTSVGTAVAMAMDVPLSFLDQVDLVGNSIDILLFVVWDLLYTFSIPADVVSARKILLLEVVRVLVRGLVNGQVGSTIDEYSGRHDE